MKNHLHPLTHYGHNIKMGVRLLQLIFTGLGLLLAFHPETVPLQRFGVLCALVLFIMVAESTRRWVHFSELHLLRVSPLDPLQRHSISLRYGLISLLVLQACWWILHLLHLSDHLSWSAFFVMPLPEEWSTLQLTSGLTALLLWGVLERWTHGLQHHLQGQVPPRPLQLYCNGVGLLTGLLQLQYLIQLCVLPLVHQPVQVLDLVQVAVHEIYALFLICFLGWIRGYLQHMTALHTLRAERRVQA